MMFSTVASMILLLTAPAPKAVLASWSDNYFANSDWTKQSFTYNTKFTTAISRRTDGNVGGCIRLELGINNYDKTPLSLYHRGFNTALYNSAIWDPSSAPIGSIDAEFDTRWSGDQIPWRHLILKQDGIFFINGGVIADTFLWVPDGYQQTNLIASDFHEIDPVTLAPTYTSYPDFTSQGSSIQFGFGQWGDWNNPNATALEGIVDVDNWLVTLYD